MSLALCAGSAYGQNPQRGLANYQTIMSGQKKLEQLTPEERSEVWAAAGCVDTDLGFFDLLSFFSKLNKDLA